MRIFDVRHERMLQPELRDRAVALPARLRRAPRPRGRAPAAPARARPSPAPCACAPTTCARSRPPAPRSRSASSRSALLPREHAQRVETRADIDVAFADAFDQQRRGVAQIALGDIEPALFHVHRRALAMQRERRRMAFAEQFGGQRERSVDRFGGFARPALLAQQDRDAAMDLDRQRMPFAHALLQERQGVAQAGERDVGLARVGVDVGQVEQVLRHARFVVERFAADRHARIRATGARR